MKPKNPFSKPSLARVGGAAALLFSAGIHLDLYLTGYRKISVIGPLFLLQSISAIAIGLLVLFSARRTVTFAAVGLAIGTLGGYLISRSIGMFGFHEVATTAGLVTGILESLSFTLLALSLGGNRSITQAITVGRRPILRDSYRLEAVVVGTIMLVFSIIAGVGATSRSSTPAFAGFAGTHTTIVIKNFTYIPATTLVTPGETISVHNEDSVTHTLTALLGTGSSKAFDTGDIGPNQTVTFVAPRHSGAYQYLCGIHNFMTGVITVKS